MGIVREAVSSLEYATRRLIVIWYSRGLKVIEAKGCCSEVGKDAKNVGEEFAAREKENRRNSASVVTDGHPVGSRCLAQRSVAGMHFGNAKIRCKEAVGVRTGIWTEIQRAAHVLTMRVHANILCATYCVHCSWFFQCGWR